MSSDLEQVGATGKPGRVDRAEVLRAIRELNLVSAEDLDRIATGSGDDASRLVERLVEAEKITRYQANALLRRKGRGLLIGPYLIESKLGRGGVCAVFKARHRPSRRVVALRILPRRVGGEPDADQQFRRAFQAANRLSHANIVRGIEAGENRGIRYLATEYVAGYDLERLVSVGGPMSIELALHCVIEVARGLEAAHARGIVHGDVKPSQVMIDRKGAIRLLGLGLPNDSRTADGRADIYSLGCTLYYLLAAKPPFSGSPGLGHDVEALVPTLSAARPDVPVALETVYQQMMAKRSSARQKTMSDVARALEACGTSEREAGDQHAELKEFALTVMKRAPARGPDYADPSVFSRDGDAADDSWYDADMKIEDVVVDFREEVEPHSLADDQLPPLLPRIVYKATSTRRLPVKPMILAGSVFAVGIAGIVLTPRLFRALASTQRQIAQGPSVATNRARVLPAAAPKRDSVATEIKRLPDRAASSATTVDRDRQAAATFLANNEAVTIRADGKEQKLEPSATLPAGPFQLVKVRFRGTRLRNDEMLESLEGLAHLTEVDLDGCTKVTNLGIAHLAKLPALETLKLDQTAITDDGLVLLETLPTLTVLGLGKTSVTDAGLVHVKGLTKLHALGLGGSRITGAGLAQLRGMAELEDLWIDSTDVRDDGLRHLSGLPKLRRLTLWHTKVTDAGLVHLKNVPLLEDLLLGAAPVTDAGIAAIGGLEHLRILWLDGTRITNAGLVHLNRLSNLVELNLTGTAVTGPGLAELGPLKKLERLSLQGTRLGNNGIANLKGLTGLKEIDIRGTRVTSAGVQEFARMLPQCKVIADR